MHKVTPTRWCCRLLRRCSLDFSFTGDAGLIQVVDLGVREGVHIFWFGCPPLGSTLARRCGARVVHCHGNVEAAGQAGRRVRGRIKATNDLNARRTQPKDLVCGHQAVLGEGARLVGASHAVLAVVEGATEALPARMRAWP